MSGSLGEGFWEIAGSALRGSANDYQAVLMADATIDPSPSTRTDPGVVVTTEQDAAPAPAPVALEAHDDSIPEPAIGYGVA